MFSNGSGAARVLLGSALAACSLVAATAAAPQNLRALVGTSFPARVVSVIDGDTVDVVRPGETTRVRIRLEGIDSPEQGEPFTQVARTRTRVLAFDQNVRVEGRDVDRYGRLVGRVVVGAGTAAATDVSVALVTEGLACHYTQYSSDPVLARAQSDARAAGRGFWARDAQKPRCALAVLSSAAPGAASDRARPRPLVGGAATAIGPARAGTAVVYHGNVNSRVYHAPTCRNYNCPNCTRRFTSRADAEAAGFRAAGDCLRQGPR
jgi:endonuclease YncB( thermonuclease family)